MSAPGQDRAAAYVKGDAADIEAWPAMAHVSAAAATGHHDYCPCADCEAHRHRYSRVGAADPKQVRQRLEALLSAQERHGQTKGGVMFLSGLTAEQIDALGGVE